jgi:hypothetical protein
MNKAFLPHELARADHGFSRYTITVRNGMTLEEALQPEAWTHTCNRFKLYDEIRLIAADGSYRAEVIVTRLRKMTESFRVQLISKTMLAEVTPEGSAAPKGYIVNHTPKTKWRVLLDTTPPEELEREFATKEDANAWAWRHARQEVAA